MTAALINRETRQAIRERQKRIHTRRREAIFVLLGGKYCVCSSTIFAAVTGTLTLSARRRG